MDEIEKFYTVRGYQLLNQKRKLLTSAMEDYLEMIYRCSLVEGYIRINVLSDLLNVTAPSASKMVQKLTKLGFLDYKRYGIIILTENGKEIGSYLLKRHNIIEMFLKSFCNKEDLLHETELIEHVITITTLQRFFDFNRFIELNPDILEKFEQFSPFHE